MYWSRKDRQSAAILRVLVILAYRDLGTGGTQSFHLPDAVGFDEGLVISVPGAPLRQAGFNLTGRRMPLELAGRNHFSSRVPLEMAGLSNVDHTVP